MDAGAASAPGALVFGADGVLTPWEEAVQFMLRQPSATFNVFELGFLPPAKQSVFAHFGNFVFDRFALVTEGSFSSIPALEITVEDKLLAVTTSFSRKLVRVLRMRCDATRCDAMRCDA
jgi:hypothetical protein